MRQFRNIHRSTTVVMLALGLLLHANSSLAEAQSVSAFEDVGYTVPVNELQADSSPDVESATPTDREAEDRPQTATYAAPVASRARTDCASGCTCQGCTQKKKAALQTAAGAAHKPLFYLNDFSYLNDPCYNGCLLGDQWKRLGHDGCFIVDFGGQYRARYHSEDNHRGLGITGGDDDFLLHRLRFYMNTEIGENIRVFAETLHADSNYENLPIRPIEENHFDLQNLFVDVKLWDVGGRTLVARAGRQEVLLGAQRYVSPLDWANTRRTFDGGRLMYSSDAWNIDGFWLATMRRDFRDFDEANEDVALYGVYATNKTLPNGTLDWYWIAFDNELVGFYFDSIGTRYNGTLGGLLFEAEGAYQFGQNADGSDHDAGFFMTGLGKSFQCHPLKTYVLGLL